MSKYQKPKTVIIDSNIWIATITKQDSFHYESLRKIASYRAKDYTILIPIIVLIEVVSFISRNDFPASFKNNYLKEITSDSNIKIIFLDHFVSIELALRMSPIVGLKAFDYYILLYSIYFKPSNLETFDSQLKKIYNSYSK